ncbi:MAG: HEAT repeat domain-containing protein [Pseudomonadota bacterium]
MNPLLEALSSADEAERIYAVQDIGDTVDPGMVPALIRQLRVEPSRVVKDAIVFQLKQMDCSKDYPLLFTLFISPDAYFRNAAVDIFGAGGDNAVGFLTAHLDHSNREVRKLILDALFCVGTLEAILAIRAGLHDTAVNIKITAVEYLGRLEDRESVPEMIELLKDDSEPMLITTVLESLPILASESEIEKTLQTILPGGDLSRAEPLYIPEILRLTAKAADPDTIRRMIEDIADLKSYAQDILVMLGEAKARFNDFLNHEVIRGKLVELISDTEVNELARHAGCELLLEKDVLNSDPLMSIGQSLLSEDAMMFNAVRFLAASGNGTAIETLRKIRVNTKDNLLQEMIDELISRHTEAVLAEEPILPRLSVSGLFATENRG